MVPEREVQDAGKGNPPNQVVKDVDDSPTPWQVTRLIRRHGPLHLQEADRTEQFAQKSNQDDRPMADRISAGRQIAHAVNPYNHPDTLPNAHVGRSANARVIEQVERADDDPSSPRQVVDTR